MNVTKHVNPNSGSLVDYYIHILHYCFKLSNMSKIQAEFLLALF
jgi:hypothetical protein